MTESTITNRWLRRLSRISAGLLLVTVLVLVVSGWGITNTEIIYKTTFGLVDRRLANSIHRATNLPLAIFFLSHVLINIRLAFSGGNTARTRLIDCILITTGLALLVIYCYIEYWV